MRAVHLPVLALLALLVLTPGVMISDVMADEGESGTKAATVAEKALEALNTRMKARIREAELLSQAGRVQEALEAFRSVGQIYERGMAAVREISWRLAGQAEGARAARLAAKPAAEAAGGAFRGRGGARELGEKPHALDSAVSRGLKWLAAHQSPNGSWEAAGFDRWCDGKPVMDAGKRPDGLGKALYDPGVSGLAVAAFLGAGFTSRGIHPYAQVLKRALNYLRNIQDPEGCFGPRSTQQYIYNHALASLAMIEAYGMTGSPILKVSAQKALDFISLSRNPYFAWRYGVKPGDNDTSVTTWMVMALKSADLINKDALKRGKPAPLTFDQQAFTGARAWVDKVTDPDTGRVGYVTRGSGVARPQALVDRFPSDRSEAMTAAGMLVRTFTGENPATSKPIQQGASLLSNLPPVWNPSDGSIDMYYWYYGTLAMFQVGGPYWRTWKQGMQRAMLETQRLDTDACEYLGSWDPIGPWGPDGGRVYSTAMMCLCLQVYYRYERVFGNPK